MKNPLIYRGMRTKVDRKILFRVVVGSLAALLVLSGALWKYANSRTHQMFGGIVSQVETEEKVVALTFDDGPTNSTGRIIEILDSMSVKATFYVTGEELEEHMEEGRRLVREGHELGNHSYSHRRMVFRSRAFISKEIEQTSTLIRETGFGGTITFRPPYFKKFIALPHYLMKHGYQTVLCNIEPESVLGFSASGEAISKYVAEHIAPGSIILLHIMYESRREALESLKDLIPDLRAEGYRFVTVSELLGTGSDPDARPRY